MKGSSRHGQRPRQTRFYSRPPTTAWRRAGTWLPRLPGGPAPLRRTVVTSPAAVKGPLRRSAPLTAVGERTRRATTGCVADLWSATTRPSGRTHTLRAHVRPAVLLGARRQRGRRTLVEPHRCRSTSVPHPGSWAGTWETVSVDVAAPDRRQRSPVNGGEPSCTRCRSVPTRGATAQRGSTPDTGQEDAAAASAPYGAA
jgi:hypothetical protein